MKLVYLAAPYTNVENKDDLMDHIFKVCAQYMIDNPGEYVIPGLIHHYSVLRNSELGTDYVFWQEFCETLMSKCSKMIVLKYTGYDQSTGVMEEIKYAEKYGIPVIYYDIITPQQGEYTWLTTTH